MTRTYDDDSFDALDHVRDLVAHLLKTQNVYSPSEWSPEELKAMKRWLDQKLDDH